MGLRWLIIGMPTHHLPTVSTICQRWPNYLCYLGMMGVSYATKSFQRFNNAHVWIESRSCKMVLLFTFRNVHIRWHFGNARIINIVIFHQTLLKSPDLNPCTSGCGVKLKMLRSLVRFQIWLIEGMDYVTHSLRYPWDTPVCC